jgi:uncharacterized protein (DUF488 family)
MIHLMSGTIYTIGHSNHPIEAFVDLLRRHDIACLADVRSHPGSRWAPQYNQKKLQSAMADAGISYLWLGKALGGKRDDPALLTPDGRPDYAKIAMRPDFRQGVEMLGQLARGQRTAMMCAEEDPARCHRKHLVGTALATHDFGIRHIRGDGTLIKDEDLADKQGSLFDEEAG